MQNIDYSENLFRSIDTIVAERVKNLPYDTTQLMEITDDNNANAGIYKITSDHQFNEIAYSDNPTYEKGDKVYVLNSADNKQRRFIIGLYQRNTNGRTDRIMSILNGSLISLKDLLQKQIQDGLDGLDGKIDELDVYFGLTADGILSIVAAKEEGLATMIRQTADEIRMEAENTYEGLNSSFSITAGQIRSEVHDLTAGLESSITQTAGQIRSEVHDYYNELESSITQTAGQIRSEVHDYKNGLESSITQTAERIETNVADLRNQMETLISQTAYEIRSEAFDIQNGLHSEISQTAEEINFKVEDVNQGLSIVSQTAAEIDSKVIDLEGNFSDISQTAAAITQRVTDMEGDFSLLEQTANQINSRVEAVEGNYSEIIQTADEISNRVESVEGNFSELKQTANEISSRVETVEGNYSQISQTAAEISSRVEDVEGNYSEFVQNINGITSTVEKLGEGYSQINQTVNSISLSVNNGPDYSDITLTKNGIDMVSKQIKFTGEVVFKNNLTDSTTTISGNNIKTGSIDAKAVDLSYLNSKLKGGGISIAVGTANDEDFTYGAMLYGYENGIANKIKDLKSISYNSDQDYWYWKDASTTPIDWDDVKASLPKNYLIATNTGVRMTNGTKSFYIAGNNARITNTGLSVDGEIKVGGEVVHQSDRNVKNTINYDLTSYEDFYNQLQPVSYIYNKDNKNKIHTGFIYQDVEKALLRNGLKSSNFAGVYKTHEENGEIWCGLAYNEFIALNTHMIQKTRKEKKELEQRTTELENKVVELENLVQQLLQQINN